MAPTRRITADEYMRQPPRPDRRGRPSLLAPYAADLAKMRANHYQLADLQDFLKKNGVEVGVSTISMFFARQKQKQGGAKSHASHGFNAEAR